MRLNVDDEITIVVVADQLFNEPVMLSVKKNETYQFHVPPGEKWKDAFVTTGVNGFWNPLLLFSGKRVKGVRCFVLCGCYNKDESTGFRIGKGLKNYSASADGNIYFFANDSIRHYDNNSGSIKMKATRIN